MPVAWIECLLARSGGVEPRNAIEKWAIRVPDRWLHCLARLLTGLWGSLFFIFCYSFGQDEGMQTLRACQVRRPACMETLSALSIHISRAHSVMCSVGPHWRIIKLAKWGLRLETTFIHLLVTWSYETMDALRSLTLEQGRASHQEKLVVGKLALVWSTDQVPSEIVCNCF